MASTTSHHLMPQYRYFVSHDRGSVAITLCLPSEPMFIIVHFECDSQFSNSSFQATAFCFKLRNTAMEMLEMLKASFSDNGFGRTQNFACFSFSIKKWETLVEGC
jgi:hypothetical protein